MRFMKVKDPTVPEGARYQENVDLVREVESDDPAYREGRETYVVRRSDGMEVYADREDLHLEDLAAARKTVREGNQSHDTAAPRSEVTGQTLFRNDAVGVAQPPKFNSGDRFDSVQQTDVGRQVPPSAAVLEERRLASALGPVVAPKDKEMTKDDEEVKTSEAASPEVFSDSGTISTASSPIVTTEAPAKRK